MLVAFNTSVSSFCTGTLANHFPLVARDAADILNLGVTRTLQKRERLTASRPREGNGRKSESPFPDIPESRA